MINYLVGKFVGNHQQVEDIGVRGAYGKLAGMVGIVCNFLLFCGKLLIGIWSGSVAIIADAINNLSDAAASIVTLVGFKLAEKPADADHPYGHARMEYVAGLIVAGMILVIGVELAQTSVGRILNPEDVTFSLLTLIILVASILVKIWLGVFNHTLGKKIDSGTLKATAVDCRNDVLTTSAVLVCAVVTHVTHLHLDGYVGLVVAAFIIWSGVTIAKDTINPLLGEAPTDQLKQVIAGNILEHPKVLGIHDMMVHDYGPGRRFATVHVEMDSRENPLECHDIIDDLERHFAECHNIHLVIHYDPVVMDNEESNRLQVLVHRHLNNYDARLSLHDFRMVQGPGHTNLVFDVVMPYEMDSKKREMAEFINQQLSKEEKSYYAVITFDHTTFNR
ncbi:MAG: cation diffusion facilitator family transporter [Eubacteriales bacterium]